MRKVSSNGLGPGSHSGLEDDVALRSSGAVRSFVSVVPGATFSAFTAKESLDLGAKLVGGRNAPPRLERGLKTLDVFLYLGPLFDDVIELFALRGCVGWERTQRKNDIQVTSEPLEKSEHRGRVRRADVVRRLCEETDRWDAMVEKVHLDNGNGRSRNA